MRKNHRFDKDGVVERGGYAVETCMNCGCKRLHKSSITNPKGLQYYYENSNGTRSYKAPKCKENYDILVDSKVIPDSSIHKKVVLEDTKPTVDNLPPKKEDLLDTIEARYLESLVIINIMYQDMKKNNLHTKGIRMAENLLSSTHYKETVREFKERT